MSKNTKSTKVANAKVRQDTPVVVFMWAFGLGLMGYMIARFMLSSLPHPIHWLAGFVGMVVGYFIGWFWYRWRGDVI